MAPENTPPYGAELRRMVLGGWDRETVASAMHGGDHHWKRAFAACAADLDAANREVLMLREVVQMVRRECSAHNRMPEGPPDRCCAQVFREGQADLARDLLALLPTPTEEG